VFYKAHTEVKSIGYEDTVREALCFGWIDCSLRAYQREHDRDDHQVREHVRDERSYQPAGAAA
jgi:uncharacterized protein YdeI (YjbR/CyaY-like superfamily)